MTGWSRVHPFLLSLLVTALTASEHPVTVYGVPVGGRVEPGITMTVDGRTVPVLRWTSGSRAQAEYLYARFAVAGEAAVRITGASAIGTHRVLPAAFGIQPKVDGADMTFTLPGPRYALVTIDRTTVMVLADPPEANAPRPGDAAVLSLPASVDPTGREVVTTAVQGLIDAAAARPGGGVAYIPPGTFRVGPLRLRSNATVYLADGAMLRFDAGITAPGKDFGKVVHHDHESVHPGVYVLTADDVENVRIAGRGIIDLDGGAYYAVGGGLVSGMRLQKVHNLTVEGVTIRDASSWTILTAACEGVRFENVKVLNGMGFEQNDGFDIISCHDVRIDHCFVYARDDAYCLKGGGRGTHGGGITVEPKAFGAIAVRDCVAYTRDGSAFKMGNQSSVGGTDFVCSDLYAIAGRNAAFLALFDGPATFQDIRIDHVFIDQATMIPFKVQIKKGGQVKDLAVTRVYRDMQPVSITIPKEMQPSP